MAGAGRYAQIGRTKHGDTSHAKKSPSSNDSTAACNKTPKKDARPSASEESRVAAASNYTRRQPRHGHRRLTTLAGMSNVQRRTSAICGPSSGRRTRVTDMKFLALCQELSHRGGKTSSCINGSRLKLRCSVRLFNEFKTEKGVTGSRKEASAGAGGAEPHRRDARRRSKNKLRRT